MRRSERNALLATLWGLAAICFTIAMVVWAVQGEYVAAAFNGLAAGVNFVLAGVSRARP